MQRFQAILLHARLAPDRPAIAFAGGVATYAMLRAAVLSAATRLDALPLRHGDVVALDIRNPFHHLALILALDWRGIASLSVQTNFDVAKSGVAVTVLLMDRYVSPSPELRAVLVEDDWFSGAPAGERLEPEDDDTVLRIAFSSGTTGLPKATAMRVADVRRRMEEVTFAFASQSGATIRYLNMLGLSTNGGYLGCLYALMTGGLICFAPNPTEALQFVRLFDITEIALAPIQLRALIDLQRNSYTPTPSLRVLVVAGGWTSDELIRETIQRLCSNVLITYGSTEMGSLTLGHAASVLGIDGAVGHPVPWRQVEVVAPDGGGAVRPGEIGEIRVPADTVLPYLQDDEATRRFVRDGWYYPGDAAFFRDDGVLVLRGRTVDLINHGGVTVAPDAIEPVLRERLQLVDVGVFGNRVAGGIEEIWAAVVAPPGFDPAKATAAMRPILGDRAPDRIVPVAIIPRNEMGKVMRPKLKEAVLAELARTGG